MLCPKSKYIKVANTVPNFYLIIHVSCVFVSNDSNTCNPILYNFIVPFSGGHTG